MNHIGGGGGCVYMLGVHHSRLGRPHYLVATKNKPYTDLNTSRALFFKISSYNTLYHIGSGCGCLYVFTVQYGLPGRPHCTIDIANTPSTTQSICKVPFCKISMYDTFAMYWWWLWLCICVWCAAWPSRHQQLPIYTSTYYGITVTTVMATIISGWPQWLILNVKNDSNPNFGLRQA